MISDADIAKRLWWVIPEMRPAAAVRVRLGLKVPRKWQNGRSCYLPPVLMVQIYDTSPLLRKLIECTDASA